MKNVQTSAVALLVVLFSLVTRAQAPSHVGSDMGAYLRTLEQASKSEYKISDQLKNSEHNILFQWASWCDVCKGMMPALQESFKKVQDCGVSIYFLAVNDKVASAEKDLNTLFPGNKNLMDDKGFIRKVLNIRSIPSVLVMNKEGILVKQYERGAAVRFPQALLNQFKGRSCVKK